MNFAPLSAVKPGDELWPISRNPLVKVFDLSESGSTARSWKQHEATANEVAGKLDGNGAVFAVVEPSGRGFWASEWSITWSPSGPSISRRRAAHGKTKESAIKDASVELSFHSSHYFRPEEGWLGRWKRL